MQIMELRKKLDMTQQAFAEAVGVAVRTVAWWEAKGTGPKSRNTQEKIAKLAKKAEKNHAAV